MVKTEGIPVSLSRQVFQIAWPAALEALLVSVVDLVDMAMVSSLKLTAVSAVGVTSQPKRILLMFTRPWSAAGSEQGRRKRPTTACTSFFGSAFSWRWCSMRWVFCWLRR